MKGYSTGYASSLSTLYLFFFARARGAFFKSKTIDGESWLLSETHYQCQLIAGFTLFIIRQLIGAWYAGVGWLQLVLCAQ
jgi:hypothetical protein